MASFMSLSINNSYHMIYTTDGSRGLLHSSMYHVLFTFFEAALPPIFCGCSLIVISNTFKIFNYAHKLYTNQRVLHLCSESMFVYVLFLLTHVLLQFDHYQINHHVNLKIYQYSLKEYNKFILPPNIIGCN